jgi:hypothetical protein
MFGQFNLDTLWAIHCGQPKPLIINVKKKTFNTNLINYSYKKFNRTYRVAATNFESSYIASSQVLVSASLDSLLIGSM